MGKWELVLMLINSIIGAGIFGLPSTIFRLTGVYSLLAFLICAVIVFIFIVCFAEVGSRFSRTGGPYTYVLEAFGRAPAFGVGWLLLLSRIFNYATLINLLVTYLSVFHPSIGYVLARALIMTGVTALLTYINYIGVQQTVRASTILTIAKLFPLLLFILAGFFFFDISAFAAPQAPGFASFSQAILLLVFAFGGFESVMVNTGEIRNPRKNIPFGLLCATAVVAFFYILIQLACIGTLPGLAASERPLADAATRMFGPAGGKAIAAGALISITGTLNVLLFSGSRLPFAFSKEAQFPSFFSVVHHRYHTPVVSLMVVAAVTLLVSIAWTFLTALTFAVIIRVLVYLFVAASLIQLRKKNPEQTDFFRLKKGNLIAGTAILLCFWLLSNAKAAELRNVSIFMVIGLVIYLLQKQNRNTHSVTKKT